MRSLSGIQPSGTLHLGNYFGSLKANIECIPAADESFYFIADLHALTTVQDPTLLRTYRRNALLDLLACGFDPEKAVVFFQSDVCAHTELSWILSTVSPVGLLERAVSYKEKVEKGIPASVGLFTYPVLMAADILLYSADIVPVGKDQKQHVEIARDIAGKFNHTYGETFTLPEPQIKADVAIVPGTDGRKMSKSVGNTIPIFGSEKEIQKAIMGIVTDSKGVQEPKDPETCTVFNIHKLFLSAAETKALAATYKAGGLGYGDAKKKMLTTVMEYFEPMRVKREKLAKDPKALESLAAAGAAKASAVAEPMMERVRKAVGLR